MDRSRFKLKTVGYGYFNDHFTSSCFYGAAIPLSSGAAVKLLYQDLIFSGRRKRLFYHSHQRSRKCIAVPLLLHLYFI